METKDERQPVSRRVAFMTLGCKVNGSETEGIRQMFEDLGYQSVSDQVAADVYVINTCTVTGTGDAKSRRMIRRARSLNPRAVIAAVGCYAQVAPEEVAAVGQVDLVLGNNFKHLVARMADERIRAMESDEGFIRKQDIFVMDRDEMDCFEALPILQMSGHTRAFVKVQDGCDCFCSYCIIPHARGPVRSREAQDVLDEVIRLVAQGFTEVVLTGIHLASYQDLSCKDGLAGLVQKVAETEGIRRIRLGSLEPVVLENPFLERLRTVEKLCPHFHLSLQSGSASVLTRMNRQYDPMIYKAVVQNLRERFPEAALTTDVMVGFPGETDQEHKESLSFCTQIAFSGIHVFPYSRRRGTPAASMSGQIPREVKETRAAEMNHLSEGMRQKFLLQQVGKTAEVLLEQPLAGRPGWMEGLTPQHVPVAVMSSTAVSGEYCTVKLVAVEETRLLGEIVGPALPASPLMV